MLRAPLKEPSVVLSTATALSACTAVAGGPACKALQRAARNTALCLQTRGLGTRAEQKQVCSQVSGGHLRNVSGKPVSGSQPGCGFPQLWVLSKPRGTSFSGSQVPGCLWPMETAPGTTLPLPRCETCARCGLSEAHLMLVC